MKTITTCVSNYDVLMANMEDDYAHACLLLAKELMTGAEVPLNQSSNEVRKIPMDYWIRFKRWTDKLSTLYHGAVEFVSNLLTAKGITLTARQSDLKDR